MLFFSSLAYVSHIEYKQSAYNFLIGISLSFSETYFRVCFNIFGFAEKYFNYCEILVTKC